jgi:hypothetical protein
MVRDEWIAWAREQPNPKPSWLTPWEELTEPEREVDRRIGVRVADAASKDVAERMGEEFNKLVERTFARLRSGIL